MEKQDLHGPSDPCQFGVFNARIDLRMSPDYNQVIIESKNRLINSQRTYRRSHGLPLGLCSRIELRIIGQNPLSFNEDIMAAFRMDCVSTVNGMIGIVLARTQGRKLHAT